MKFKRTKWEIDSCCADCPRRKPGKFVPPDIKKDSPLAILGEAPGEVEMNQGRVFIGGSGKVLNKLLSKSGSHREEVSVLNTCMCGLPRNPTPTPKEIAACALIVERALDMISPEVVLALGDTATSRLVGKRSVTTWRGSILETPKTVVLGKDRVYGPDRYGPKAKKAGQLKPHWVELSLEQLEGQRVIISFHPAKLMRDGFKTWPLALADFKRAVALSKEKPLIHVGQEMGKKMMGASEAEEFIGRHKELCVDVETSMETGKLLMVGMATSKDKVAVFKPTKALGRLLNDWNKREGSVFIAHNAEFDIEKLEQIGTNITCPLFDTMHAAQFERPDIRLKGTSEGVSYNKFAGLDQVASRMPRLYYTNWKEAFRSGEQDNEQFYCMMDCGTEFYLYEELRKRLEKTGRLSHFLNVLMPLQYVLMDMQRTGIKVDQNQLARLRNRQVKLVKRYEDLWAKSYPNINPCSTSQLKKYFYEELGLPPIMTGRGASRRPTFDKEAIPILAERHPECLPLKHVLALRHVAKMLHTYLEPELDANGRIHFRYNLSGTYTGRLSSDGQQLPRPNEEGACNHSIHKCACGEIRSIFVADKGDLGICVADYGQIEARITALLAGEDWLIKKFQDPAFDLHQETGDLMDEFMGGTERDPSKRRKKGKQARHLMNYHGGILAVMGTFDCSRREAQMLLDSYKTIHPSIARWWKDIEMFVQKNGYVVNPWGRRAYFMPDRFGKYDINKAIAFTPQSSAGEYIYEAMIAVWKEGLKLRFQAHDELGISVEYEDDPKILKEIMEWKTNKLTWEGESWFCPVDVGIGSSWMEAKLQS